ncbi:MAG: potassium channel family protein [Candidatus Aminicenantaceae bacterium]
MKQLKFKVKVFFIIFISILVAGSVTFSLLEGIPLTDAFYFTIATISTVGYGDVHPITNTGKIVAVLIIILGVGAFLGIIANSVEIVLSLREKKQRSEKLNMIIGAFFSEAGTQLIAEFSQLDPEIDRVRKHLAREIDSTIHSFDDIKKKLKAYSYRIELHPEALPSLKKFLTERKHLFLHLMENPHILEHESFTELLMAVFHLAEELEHRKRIRNLPDEDQDHLRNDIERVYALLVYQWLDYMEHLKKNYPYLFSLALRLNPFNPEASAVIES